MMHLRGAYTALITPMHADGSINYDGFRLLIKTQIEKGISGLLPLGTTGETPVLERDEQDTLVSIAVEQANGKLPVIVGVGSNSTAHTITNAKRATELGADVILVVTPYYNKPSNEGIYRHFAAVADACDTPILVYNIASRTGTNIDVPTMRRLASIPSVLGVKESSGDIAQITDMIRIVAAERKAQGSPFAVLSGDDAFTLPLCALGGDGVVSVVSNLVPDRVAALTEACLSGDYKKAQSLHHALVPLIRGAFIETNPVPIKTAMGWARLPSGPVRLPLYAMEKKNEERLREALADAGIQL